MNKIVIKIGHFFLTYLYQYLLIGIVCQYLLIGIFCTIILCLVYSSSFAEMGLAIDEKIKTSEIEDFDYDELQLSPAHQVLISCIWMSLKVYIRLFAIISLILLYTRAI